MENRKSRTPATRSMMHSVHATFLISLQFCVFGLMGCGAPGEPIAPSPPTPVAITDLRVRQSGDGAQLTFTLPNKTVHGDRLTETPAIEILRGNLKIDGSPDSKSFRVVETIPGTMVGKYLSDDHVQVVDAVSPEDTRLHPGATLAYRVRTRVSKKRASPDSNAVSLAMFPVPQRISELQAKVTEAAIELKWSASARTSGGETLSEILEQHIYRGEIDPRPNDRPTKDLSGVKWIAPLVRIGQSDEESFLDSQFEFGKTYVYVVRSATKVQGNSLESDPSDPLLIAPVDTFAPAAPQNVIAAVTSGTSDAAPEVDLSWSINSETDVAGYRVYRSEEENEEGEPVATDLLLSPAYRDTSVRSNSRYWYRVTAVDRAGNESVPSAPVLADVAQHSP
jgi:hypothetical protein